MILVMVDDGGDNCSQHDVDGCGDDCVDDYSLFLTRLFRL